MSFNIQVYSRVDGLLGTEAINDGSLDRAVTLPVTGQVLQKTFTIANAASKTIYSTDFANFKFLRVVSDLNTRMVLTDTASNTFAVRLRGTGVADKYGVPFQLGSDVTASGQTLITMVVHNASGNTAKVKVLVFS